MLFFEQYFNKHHLFHAPHKWFLALLSSPIHFLEMHYKKRYHLQFPNARKLFIFDVSLFLSILVLIAAVIFWCTYNPTVTSKIKLSITPSIDRIMSGDYVTYTVNYQNNSKAALASPCLAIQLPPGFILHEVEPKENFSQISHSFGLDKLPAGAGGTAKISGWIYGTPNQEYLLTAHLSYHQENRSFNEEKTTALINILRGSVLQTSATAPDKILNRGQTLIKIELKNNGQQNLSGITLPLFFNGLSIQASNTTLGEIKQSQWTIKELKSGDMAVLAGILNSQFPANIQQISWQLTPEIKINNQNFPQATFTQIFNILHPQIEFNAKWLEEKPAQPGDIRELAINIKNNSVFELQNLSVSLAIPNSLIDSSRLEALNPGSIQNSVFAVNKNYSANLAELKKGQSVSLPLSIPITASADGGTDLTLSLSPRLKTEIKQVEKSTYETTANTPSIKIGTRVLLNAEMRYYTDEGDQLGRGTLPPKVGEETKYWAMIKIENTTSRITSLKLSAVLPNYVKWAGKTSVSHGKDVVFDESTRQISWSLPSLSPHEKAGVYFEISLTPAAEQKGTAPILLKNIQISAHDQYINKDLNVSSPDLDASLKGDKIAQKKGTIVK